MGAWYQVQLDQFLEVSVDSIIGDLARLAGDRNLPTNRETQQSWRNTVEELRKSSKVWCDDVPNAFGWTLFLEYEVPRRSRRIDAVLIAHDLVILMEFKDGSARYDRDARWQAEQYALDIRDFHSASRDKRIAPFLVATASEISLPTPDYSERGIVLPLACVNFAGLTSGVLKAFSELASLAAPSIDAKEWDQSPYRPTPWIVEAARDIFNQNDIREIQLAGSQNLDRTVEAVLELVNYCKENKRHGIAFITGAPGSGKTLAGLQVVHSAGLLNDEKEASGVFLSGNMPLVEVICGALALDAEARQSRGVTVPQMRRIAETFVQHAYKFRNFYTSGDGNIPQENVILFDEAQRAWDANQVRRKTNLNPARSEPELFLDIMGRAIGWSVIIAVVGSGQEINTGEAGLGEWGHAIADSNINWVVRVSPQVVSGNVDIPGGPLLQTGETIDGLVEDPRLHLNMNLRSPRAEVLNQWVDAVIDLRLSDARKLFESIGDFPIVLTRDLEAARKWLKDKTDEDHRCGLVANASARRLRAWGLDTKALRTDGSWADWFLKPKGDIRSSYQLEVPATNFDCQGLELDWVGMCWGNDMTVNFERDNWLTKRLTGTTWRQAQGDNRKFMLNSYRVLLTRARKGMVIWVPLPDGSDHTMDPIGLDRTAALLTDVGVPGLTD